MDDQSFTKEKLKKIMIEHYSHKIQNAIQKELFKANSSIKIAVAWFTNDLLFQPLLLKLGTAWLNEVGVCSGPWQAPQ